jgi:hypothetical protein
VVVLRGSQVTRSHAPDFEHERDGVVEGEAEAEGPHERDCRCASAKTLSRDLGDIRVRDPGAADDSEIGNTREEHLASDHGQ